MFITYSDAIDGKAMVKAIVYNEKELSVEAKANGLFVASIPEPDRDKGMPRLYVNPETKELWHEYEPIPAPPIYPPTEVGQLQKQVDDLKLLLAELVTGVTV